MKNLKDWKEEIEKSEYQEWNFEIKCLKCKSKNVIIDKKNDIGYSEYTGMWGDASAVVKCLDCGNAFAITVVEN